MKTLKSTMILFFLFSQLTFCTSDKKKNDTIVLLGLIAITKQANPKSSDPNSSSQGDGGAPQTEGSNGGDGSGGGSSGGVELPAQQNTPIISMVSSSPGNGEEATKWNKSILITFDKNVTKPNGNISITVGGNNVTFTSEVNDKVLKLTVTSDVDLNNDQTVSVVILKEAIENLNENYSFSFTAKATYQAISSVKYSTSTFEFQVGDSINIAKPTITGGGQSFGFSIEPELPSGLTLADDGSITGSVSTALAKTSYKVKVTDGISSGEFNFDLTISEKIIAPSNFSYNPGSLNFVQGNKICSDASVTGTKPFSFVEKETLPDGVILDGETGRVCSDGSTGKITAGDYIIEVSNKAGKATSTLKLSGVVCQEGAIDVAYHVQSSDFGEIKYSVCRNGDWSDWIVRTVSFTSYESPSLLRESVTNNVSLKAYCSPNAFGLTISCVLAKEDNSGLKCKNKIQVFGNNTGSPSFSYTNDPATSSILELYNQTWNPNSIPRFEINPKGKEYLFIRFRSEAISDCQVGGEVGSKAWSQYVIYASIKEKIIGRN